MRIVLVGAELEENLAVRYLWGALAARGHEVSMVVFNGPDDLHAAGRRIADSGAAIVGLSMVFTRRAREFAWLAARARELGFSGHIVAGGPFAAFNALDLLRDCPAIDSVARGEGEAILCRLADVKSLEDLSAVEGLVWRGADGLLVENGPAAKPARLDSLAWPVRKSPPDSYFGLPIVNALASRGCTRRCAFCSIAAWHRLCGGERYRQRDPERVADELAALYQDGVRLFNFHDDNFLPAGREAALERVDRLGAALRSRKVGRIAFAVKARPDEVELELFERLRAIGLFRVFLGVEAGTADSLRRLGRGQTIADNERALEVVDALDLHACFNLLLWNPGSSLEDVAANVEFLARHPRNAMNFCRTEVYSGTPLEARLRRAGRLRGSYWGYDYEMADERAQLSFEIAYGVLRERCHGDRSAHHWAMRLDYEYHVLRHFFGEADALRREVKGYVVEVNLDTVRHLRRVVEAVAAGLDHNERERFVAALSADVSRRDRELDLEATRILAAIHSLAAVRQRRRPPAWAARAVAAGLAATLSLASAACPQDCRETTYPTETTPTPVEPIPPVQPPPPEPRPADASVPAPSVDAAPLPTHPSEMAPPPPPKPPDAGPADAGPPPATHMHERAPFRPHPTEMAPMPPPGEVYPTHPREMAPMPPEEPTFPSEEAPMPPRKK